MPYHICHKSPSALIVLLAGTSSSPHIEWLELVVRLPWEQSTVIVLLAGTSSSPHIEWLELVVRLPWEQSTVIVLLAGTSSNTHIEWLELVVRLPGEQSTVIVLLAGTSRSPHIEWLEPNHLKLNWDQPKLTYWYTVTFKYVCLISNSSQAVYWHYQQKARFLLMFNKHIIFKSNNVCLTPL